MIDHATDCCEVTQQSRERCFAVIELTHFTDNATDVIVIRRVIMSTSNRLREAEPGEQTKPSGWWMIRPPHIVGGELRFYRDSIFFFSSFFYLLFSLAIGPPSELSERNSINENLQTEVTPICNTIK